MFSGHGIFTFNLKELTGDEKKHAGKINCFESTMYRIDIPDPATINYSSNSKNYQYTRSGLGFKNMNYSNPLIKNWDMNYRHKTQ
jgi:hypothetical protein